MASRNPKKGRKLAREPLTGAEKLAVSRDHESRRANQGRRDRRRAIGLMRVKHAAGTHLRPIIEEECRRLAQSEAAYGGIADLLDEIADELRKKARKAHDRIVRAVDSLRPKLVEASRLAKDGSTLTEIDRRVGLTKWIEDVGAEVTVAEIVSTITKPKRHEFWVDAYQFVGRIRDVSLTWWSVKRIYGKHRPARR